MTKDKYFRDGFLFKHSGIYPEGFDKDNLFEEQKNFLVYLMGYIPSVKDWTLNVEYKIRADEIKKLSIDDIELTEVEKDVCLMHGGNIIEEKKKKLSNIKKTRYKNLKEDFGIKDKEEENENQLETELDKQPKIPNSKANTEQIWRMISGKMNKEE